MPGPGASMLGAHNPAMTSIRASRPDEGARAIEIWRHAVDATHDFLSPQDRAEIDEMVCGFLPNAPLWFAVDEQDHPLAFMLLTRAIWKRCLWTLPSGTVASVRRWCATA